MIKNYIKIAIRSLARNKSFAFINVLGLVVGISFSTMLYIYVSHELSYDSFHAKADRTFRIVTRDGSDPAVPRQLGRTAPPMGPQLVSSFPEVKEMTRLFRFGGHINIEIGDSKYMERNWFFTPDPNFFELFDFEFLAGDKKTALVEPFSLVLNESTAKKYFPDGSALGKTIKTSSGEVKITGIVKDLPVNSHLQFDVLLSTYLSGEQWTAYLNNWQRLGAFTYVVLDDSRSIEKLREKMPDFMSTHFGADAKYLSTQFQAIQDIYLHSDGIEGTVENVHGELSYVYIFSSMALFLLIVAAINYINLTTSKASLRFKEIGVRKVVGAVRRQLIYQFLTEAFIVTLVSMIISLVAINLLLPYFNSITGKQFELSFQTIGEFLPSLLLIALIIGVLAGSYPAFYLAKLKPVATLTRNSGAPRGGLDLRTGLVVFQFIITITLIICTLVIGDQMNFIQTKDLGFDKEQMMIIDINNRNSRAQFQTMKTEFGRIPGVKNTAVSSQVPGEWKVIDEVYVRRTNENSSAPDSLQSYFMGFDEDMARTYNLQLVDGAYFSGSEADSMNVVINEAAVKAFNLANPVGSKILVRAYGTDWNVNVIGVLKDFNFQSLHQKIAPIIIGFRNNPVSAIDYFTLQVSSVSPELIAEATRVHEKFDTTTPIEYHFLSEQLNRFYTYEKKAGMIFQMAGGLSILVGCLGLLGLVAYQVERKTKELGIRKVLGADPANLFFIVSSTFARNVLIAFALAAPIAWFIMREWLSAFEYRIPLTATSFILAGVFVFLLVLLTVSFQSIKAALLNPVDSLRQE